MAKVHSTLHLQKMSLSQIVKIGKNKLLFHPIKDEFPVINSSVDNLKVLSLKEQQYFSVLTKRGLSKLAQNCS